MKKNEHGLGAVGILAVIVIVALTGTVGWLVYDRQKSNNEAATTQKNEQTDNASSELATQELDYKTADGINYKTPSNWKNVKEPYEPYESGSGQYLLSPDYKEAGGGQLHIEVGAFIHFEKLEWVGIDSNTTVEQAVSVVKNGEGGYLDPSSVKATTVSGKQVVIFNAGHTTDGVTVFHKTSSGQWLSAGFSTVTGQDANYNAQDSPHYKTFLSWLEEFIKLNP